MSVKIGILEPIQLPPDVKIKVFDIPPPPPKGMFADMPVDVGPQYEGQRIRGPEMYVELGGDRKRVV